MRNDRLHDLARGDGGKVILRRPFGAVGLGPEVDLAGLEGLEHHAAIAEVVIAQLVKVVAATVHRQIAAPIVGVAAKADVAPKLMPADNVGAGADGRDIGGVGKVAARELRLLQDRPHPHQHRQLAVRRIEADPQLARPGRFDLGDLGPGGVIARAALGAERLIAPDHIRDGHRRAVRESGAFAQGKLDPAPGGIGLDRFGQKAVKRERLVQRARHHRLDDMLPHRPGRAAFEDVGVEAVEAAAFALTHPPALGRIGVHIGQRHKIRWKGRGTIHSYAMRGLGQGRCCSAENRSDYSGEPPGQTRFQRIHVDHFHPVSGPVGRHSG